MFDGNDVPPSDAALIRRTAAGESSAFDILVRRHQAAVRRFTRELAGDPAQAEDALLETFLAAWRGSARRRDDSVSVLTWLLTLARQALTRQNLGRQPAVQAAENTPLRELAQAAGWGRSGLAAESTGRQALETAFAALNPADREILVLRDLEGLAEEEAAAVIGTSEAVVRARLHRARLRLLAKLREGGSDGG